jgi:hypothetical protein
MVLMTSIVVGEQDEIRERRTEELEALQAFYGDDHLLVRSSSCPRLLLVDGPWFLRLRRQLRRNDDENGRKIDYSVDDIGLEPTLEIQLTPTYPLGDEAPMPLLHNVMMDPILMLELLSELRSIYSSGTDVGILWGERCREGLERGDMKFTFDDDVRIAEDHFGRSRDVDDDDDDDDDDDGGAKSPITAENLPDGKGGEGRGGM